MLLILYYHKPWGKKEWQGDWSEKSDKWTPELKEQLKVEFKDDGIFWISAPDFIKQFEAVTVGKVFPDYYYNSVRASIAPV